jgi:hypothetical protein
MTEQKVIYNGEKGKAKINYEEEFEFDLPNKPNQTFATIGKFGESDATENTISNVEDWQTQPPYIDKALTEMREFSSEVGNLVRQHLKALRALGEITQIIDGLTPDNAQHIKDLVIATIAEVVQDDRIS